MDKLRGVLDIDIRETYSYTRKYDRGAYLSSHRDRPACEISTTVCLDYQTDDGKPWVIWVDNSKNWVDFEDTLTMQQETQGIPNRKRESVALSLEVGDVLVYQGLMLHTGEIIWLVTIVIIYFVISLMQRECLVDTLEIGGQVKTLIYKVRLQNILCL